jgi:hypothetical protein
VFINFAELFARAVQAGFDGSDRGAGDGRHLGLTAAFLCEREKDAVFGLQLLQGVVEGVQLGGINRGAGFGYGFVFGLNWGEESPPFFTAEVINATVACEAEKPGFKVFGIVEPVERPKHFDENDLGNILNGVAAARDGIDKAGHPLLVADDERALGVIATLLGLAYDVGQNGRVGIVHAVIIACDPFDAICPAKVAKTLSQAARVRSVQIAQSKAGYGCKLQ